MPTREEIYAAIRNADKAGDSEAVRKLGAYLQTMQDSTPAASEPETNGVAAVGAGLGRGFGQVVLNVQKLAGKGVSALGGIGKEKSITDLIVPSGGNVLERAGQWLQTDAQNGLEKIASEAAPYKRDHPVLEGAGEIGGNVVATLPVGGVLAKGASAIPGVAKAAPGLVNAIKTSGMSTGQVGGSLIGNTATRMLGGAITGGASAGLVDPSQTAEGAVLGGIAPPLISGAGKVLNIAGSAAKKGLEAVSLKGSPNADLARTAMDKYGIPVRVSDVSGNGFVKGLASLLDDTPLIGRMGTAHKEAQQQALNAAVGDTFGASAPSLTPQVMDAAKKRMGAEFDRIWNNNALQVDAPMFQKLIDLQAAAEKLPKNEGGSLKAELQDLLGKMQPDANGNVVVSGETANKFQSYLRRRAEGSAGLRNELTDLRQTIIGAFNRSVDPADAAALAANRAQYKAFKTVEPLMNSAEAGVAGRVAGDVPVGLLPQAVRKSYSDPTGAPLTDLAQIAGRLMTNRTPQTGGSARAAIQNSAIGAAVGTGAVSNPLAALIAAPVVAGVQKGMNSPAVTRSLLSQGGQPNPLAQMLMNPDLQQLIYRASPAIAASR